MENSYDTGLCRVQYFPKVVAVYSAKYSKKKKKNPLNLTLFDYGSRTATFSSQLIFAIFNSRGPYHLRTIA